jgi:hypothetical protein
MRDAIFEGAQALFPCELVPTMCHRHQGRRVQEVLWKLWRVRGAVPINLVMLRSWHPMLKSAEAAAAVEFKVSDEQRKRVVVQKRD